MDFFSLYDLAIEWMTSQIKQGTSCRLRQALCIISKPSVNSNWSYSPEILNSGQNWWFFLAHVILKFGRRPWKTTGYLFYATSSYVHHFINHQSNQTGVTVRKRPIRVEIVNFLSCVTLKFDGWSWKIIRHLFYFTSSFVHHFVAVCEFKLDLQPGYAQFRSKLTIFCSVWPWNLMNDLEKQ